jgi:hypothetical protein
MSHQIQNAEDQTDDEGEKKVLKLWKELAWSGVDKVEPEVIDPTKSEFYRPKPALKETP